MDAEGFDGPLIILVGIANTLGARSVGVAVEGLQSGGAAVGSA